MTEKKYSNHSSYPEQENGRPAGSELSFPQVQRILLRYMRPALIIFTASVFIAGLSYFSLIPDYSGDALLTVKEDVGQNKPLEALIGPDKESLELGTAKDVVLIGSMASAEQLVR